MALMEHKASGFLGKVTGETLWLFLDSPLIRCGRYRVMSFLNAASRKSTPKSALFRSFGLLTESPVF
jgi:hypothetical protein